ncbi:uncharacterized protein (TIGR02246 family) [Stackebrandtia endophytica]|uniref:Uncharacterized protein (TIGR02246 family) n=1 Tax=Stackebrandtia endophytica TaxID=1496996 RepID=A0A543AUN7_9ACTN|nr:SgcJ/EcaC family oxidoreductase [Stackebrandtia endophytica]TQL76279.1 uncharacterized protein (TIGR02246 family) [Stackebrandtia endophytica]
MNSAIETIENTLAEYVKHQNDPKEFLAMHTDETSIVNIMGRRVLGKPAFSEAMMAAMVGPIAHIRTSLDIEDIRFLRPDIAIVAATKHVHGRENSDGDLPSVGSMTLVLSQEDGQWKVAVAQTTPRVV